MLRAVLAAKKKGKRKKRQPAASKAAADEPVADDPVADDPVADEPVADDPVADDPVADEPIGEPSDETPPAEVSQPGGKLARPSRAHLWRGLAAMVVGFGGTFLLMANEGQLPHGPLYGMLLMLVGVGGLFEALGLFGGLAAGRVDIRETSLFAKDGEPLYLSPVVAIPVAIAVLAVGALVGGYDGLPITILVAIACLVPAALRRHGLMVFVVAAGLFLPFLGVYGLWDPWETHYGEVAREMLARDDWISLWWAQEDWFWSKPILIFWIESLSMGALGVDFQPDANPLHPEWAIRLPHFLLTTGALLSVYALVSKVWNRRTGLVAAVVLATMPHFFFLAHQAITDMPFVACMTMALSMLGLAMATDPKHEVKRYALGPLTLSARHLLIGGLTLVVVPQILYLASRNITVAGAFPPFGWHGDVFLSGSAGNLGVPGNSAARNVEPFFSGPGAQPVSQALIWLTGYLSVLFMVRKERRVRALYMFAFYVFCGLGFMAKGIPGFALPGLVALFFLIATKRWNVLLTGELKVGAGILTVLTVGMPWYVAMFIRHGPPFTNRLLVHDHLNRLTSGVHGDNASIEYFIEQMGYGMFPWIALAPIALGAWFMTHRAAGPIALTRGDATAAKPYESRLQPAKYATIATIAAASLFGLRFALRALRAGETAETIAIIGAMISIGGIATAWLIYLWNLPPRPASNVTAVGPRGITIIAIVWLASAFTLFSAMTTKFHHYIFPTVPPMALLVGVAVDRLLGPRSEGFDLRKIAATTLALLAPIPAVLGVAGAWGDVRGIVPESVTEGASEWVLGQTWPIGAVVALVALAGLMLAGAWWLHRDPDADPDAEAEKSPGWARGAMTTGLLAAPPVLALIGRDLSWVTDARPQGYERLIQLFVYNYGRTWPTELDYRPILTGFAIVATAVVILAAVRPLRAVAMRAFLGVALLFAVWSLDVYMIDLSPHWGQRELIQRYYELRDSDEEPLIAWQMNWKGENFYSGNRVHVFVQLDNRALRTWVGENQGRTAYFLLEPGRLNNLRGVLRGSTIDEITDPRFCNKFMLIRAQIGVTQPTQVREELD